MGLIGITIKFSVALLILWAVALIMDGEYGTLANMGYGAVSFSQSLPPQMQQALGGILIIGGFVALMKYS